MKWNTKNSWLAALMLFVFAGCGFMGSMPVEKQILISYEVMGETLNTAKPTLITLCASGQISADDCIAAREAYNNAVSIYQMLGEMALVAIDTGDSENYRTLTITLMDILTYLDTFVGEPK